MKAIVYTEYGTPDNFQLKEVDKPAIKENEVLLKVYASSINSWDWDLLKGKPFLVRLIGGLFKPKNKILGADVAGVIEAVGSRVTDFKTGDEVFGDIAGRGFGGFAEYAAVPPKVAGKKTSQYEF